MHPVDIRACFPFEKSHFCPLYEGYRQAGARNHTMTRKVFYTDTPQRRRLKQEAILILRQTRGLIDNELLEKAKAQITSRMEKIAATPHADSLYETIDRQKNMATIMKFIELKADNKNLMHEMKTILQQSQH